MPAPKDPIKYKEFIQKLRDSHKGQIPTNLEQIRNYNLGKKFTQEHIDKIRQSQIGKKKNISPEGRERMRIKNYDVWNKGTLKTYSITCVCGETSTTSQKNRKFCSLKCFSTANKGKGNYRWIDDRTQLKDDHKDRGGQLHREWSRKVKMRDYWKCKMSNKDCSGNIVAHHILSWRDFVSLRYEINNGITLCKFHHPRKRSEETELSPYFQQLILHTDS